MSDINITPIVEITGITLVTIMLIKTFIPKLNGIGIIDRKIDKLIDVTDKLPEKISKVIKENK